ncbi:class I lanthipeptide [uncultured Aquimarina sp.]|uniref:class I lanthipeptide n=1 Tax=uncultured Aquimarina sp. TaxID=575652 RepID=UPI00261213D0|nr:class I lanthipeptide [uncultured Aquimarina sp.]
MKNNKTQKISLKKLTIARININAMRKIEGGSSGITLPTEVINVDGEPWNICAFGIK